MTKEQEFDIFHNIITYEKADQIFITELPKIEDVKDDCIFVLDTNALLVPFNTGSNSLDEIGHILTMLKNQNQLIIPDQVAREFANIRPSKIGEMFQTLNKKRNGMTDPKIGSYPLLEKIDGYKEVLDIEKKIRDILKEYRNAIGMLVDTVKDWTWDDPVSQLYRRILTPEIVFTFTFEKEDIIKQLRYRYKHKIPPGFKDGGKEDEGIGDLLIWFTIIEIAKKYKKNIVFVSGDEKPDWYHRSDNIGLYPRFELISEFKNKCDDLSFHIIKLSDLLKLMGAKDEVISEVKIEEQLESDLKISKYFTPSSASVGEAVYLYYKNNYNKVVLPRNDEVPYDFKYNDALGNTIPVNVIYINGNNSISLVKVRNILQKLSYNKTELSVIQEIILVTTIKEFNFSEFIYRLRTEIYNTLPHLQLLDLRIYGGYLDENINYFPIA